MDLGFVPGGYLGQEPIANVTPCETDACRAIAQQLPPCYSQQFYECTLAMQAANRAGEQNPQLSPYCAPFWAIQQASDGGTRFRDWDAAVDSIPYCPEPSQVSAPAAKGISSGMVLLGVLGAAAVVGLLASAF